MHVVLCASMHSLVFVFDWLRSVRTNSGESSMNQFHNILVGVDLGPRVQSLSGLLSPPNAGAVERGMIADLTALRLADYLVSPLLAGLTWMLTAKFGD